MGESEDDFDGGVVLALPESNGNVAKSAAAAISKSKRKREKQKLWKATAKKVKVVQVGIGARSGSMGGSGEESRKGATVNPAIALMDPQLIADYVGQRVRLFEKELSGVEWEDRYIPASVFADTTSWSRARDLEQLPEFLQTFSKRNGRGFKIDRASTTPGSPNILVVTAAALRAADLTRALKIYQNKEAAVAKLFAKHVKLREHVEYLMKTRIGIGVGTPGRLMDLMREDALGLEDLKLVLIDASHIDQKQRGILDIKETQKSLMDLLNYTTLKRKLVEGDVRLLFF